MHHPLAYRLVVPGLVLALTGLAALPVQATPASGPAAPTTASQTLPDAHTLPEVQPIRADAHTRRPAPPPAADPQGSESLWFVGVFQ